MKLGKLIAIEGGDGCGKSSCTNYLKEILPKDSVIFSREPGGSVTSEKIREVILDDTSKNADPDTLFLLFWASRIEHIQKTIWPAMRLGKNVILDRFDASTFAYQIRAQKQNHLIRRFEEFRAEYVLPLQPHYVYLDVDPIEGKKRALQARGQQKNYFDEMEVGFFQTVKSGFSEFLRHYAINKEIIDANQSLDKVKGDLVLSLSKSLEMDINGSV